MNGEELLTTGELARRAGVSVETVRHWSDLGLVPTAGRTPAGHRLYDEEGAARLAQVRAQEPLTIRTDTLVLRPWRDEDAPAVAAAHRDPALRRWATRRIEDEAAALDWVRAEQRAWTEGTRRAFAVVGRDGSVLGGVVLKLPREVGYWTVPEARGRSVASRALEALTDWAFTTLAPDAPDVPDRLELLHQADNLASCRVAEKCAYRLSHHLPPAPPAYPRAGHVHVRERG